MHLAVSVIYFLGLLLCLMWHKTKKVADLGRDYGLPELSSLILYGIIKDIFTRLFLINLWRFRSSFTFTGVITYVRSYWSFMLIKLAIDYSQSLVNSAWNRSTWYKQKLTSKWKSSIFLTLKYAPHLTLWSSIKIGIWVKWRVLIVPFTLIAIDQIN